ncbi:MAG: hypothetical protein HY081_02145, partial [Gammaproteobacteria bacterium]|nr:hypothetical protein [Gammaproteobacteria bacterium]
NRVMTQVTSFDPASPGGPLTVEDLIVVMRDWMLGHGGINGSTPTGLSASESQTLATYFGVAALTAQASTVPSLEQKLRGLCGVMVETPQFMLAGIAPSGMGPKPRLRVCNGTPCTYQEICQALQPAINAQLDSGQTLICGSDSVNILTRIRPPHIWEEICPAGLCGPWVKLVPEGCWPGPQPFSGGGISARSCPSIEPPACDPRCARVDCCGGPLPPINQRDRTIALAWAEGAEVKIAQGVKIRPSGTDKLEDVKVGQRLQIGDLLILPAGSRFAATVKDGEFKTPAQGLPKKDAPRGALLMMVTGEKALQQQQTAASEMRKPPLEVIQRVRNSPWSQRGEAGVPLSLEEYKSYQYSKEEIGLEQLIKRGLWPVRKQTDQKKPVTRKQ